jgi:DNA polymerase I-like protein with 3'-5' exonuclease and polymerase domains
MRASKNENFSTPLEEYVAAPFVAVGSPEWIASAFEKGALEPHEIKYVTSPKELQFFRDFLLDTPERAIDTETSGPKKGNDDKNYNMNPLNDGTEMVVFQVADKEKTYLLEPALLPECKDELESEDHLNILHNAFYDWRWMFIKYDIHMTNMFCTMLAEQVATSGLSGMRVNLQDTCRRHYPHYLISKAVRDEFVNYQGYMTRSMAHYGARDCVLLHPIKDDQTTFLNKYHLMDTAQLEFDIIPCTAELELDGINLDIEKIKIIIAYWLQREAEAGIEILNLYDSELKKLGKNSDFLFEGLQDIFDLNSNQAKLKALSEMGFELEDVKRETLKETDHQLAKLLAEYSAITKKTSTYGQNMLDKVNKFTHKWHPKFHQLGSGELQSKGKDNKDTIATGRFSGDGQQFPKPVDLFCKATPEEYQYLTSKFKEQINAIKTTNGLGS